MGNFHLGLGLSAYSGRGHSAAGADKTVLQGLVDEFHNRSDSADYTTASWNDYLSAVSAGELVLADLSATQQQVDDSVVAINLAKDNLVYIADLKDAVLAAQAYAEVDYTPNSWAPFLLARNIAIAVRDDPAATQVEVNTAESTLTTRMSELVPRADKTDLIFRINQYGGLDSDDYTPATWLPYSNDVSEGIMVRDDLNATELQVTNAVQDIVLSFNALVLRADKTLLIAAISEYDNRTDQTDYSVLSWQAYSAQVVAGTIVRDNHNATQLATDNARVAIIQARDALVSIVALAEAIDLANMRAEAAYTPESWTILADAVSAGQIVYDDDAATQIQVDDAEQEILNAIDQLVPNVPACALTLTGDVATAFGFEQPTITDGNVFSNSSSGSLAYVASTELPATRAIPTSGKIVWIALDDVSISATYTVGSRPVVRAGFFGALDDGVTPTRGAQIQRDDAGTWTLFIETLGHSNTSLSIPQPPTGQYAIGVGHDGEVYICSGATITALSFLYPAYANWMAYAADDTTPTARLVIVGAIQTGTPTDTVASGRIITEQAYLTDFATLAMTGAGEDWCGNPVGVLPVDKSGLLSTINSANVLNEYEYSIASWGDLQAELVLAQAVYDDPDATQLEVDAAKVDLQAEIDELVLFDIRQVSGLQVYAPYNDASNVSPSRFKKYDVLIGGVAGTVYDRTHNLAAGAEMSPHENPLLSDLYGHSGDWVDYHDGEKNWLELASYSSGQANIENRVLLPSNPFNSDYAAVASVLFYSLGDDTPPVIGADFELIPGGNQLYDALADFQITKIEPYTYKVEVTFTYVKGDGVIRNGLRKTTDGGRLFRVSGFSIRPLLGNHATQLTAAARPIFRGNHLEFDGIDDELIYSFPAALGSVCTVSRATLTGVETLTGQTIETNFSDSTTSAGIAIFDRALSLEETSRVEHAMGKLLEVTP